MNKEINYYMNLAVEQAGKAAGEIPVGAVVVKDGLVIAKTYNTKEKDKDVTAHAEILAIREASKQLNNWRLDECDMYVTLEPCPMCGWAILQARIKNLYFGSYDNYYGAFSKAGLNNILEFKTKIYGGICEGNCDKILQNFFSGLRD